MISTDRQTDKGELTGFPSIDKPWIKYYEEMASNFSPLPSCSVYEYLYENNKNTLNDIAINFYGQRLTYGELFEKIDSAAKAFTNIGVNPGDVVTVVSISCVQSVIAFYALNRIGAVSNYINVLGSVKEINHFILEGNSKVVVSLDLFGDKVVNAIPGTDVKHVIVYSMGDYMPFATRLGYNYKMRKFDDSFKRDNSILEWNTFIQNAKNVELQINDCPNDICFYGHTGGTTGFPKSVLLTNRSFNAVTWQYVNTFVHQRGEVFLSVIVPFVTYGAVINIHMPLCLGLEVALIPKFNADEWPSYIKKYKPTHVVAIPAYIGPMADHKKLSTMNLSMIKTVGMGGEGMNGALETKVNQFLKERGSSAIILKGYGMTEVGASSATELENARKNGSIGVPFYQNNFIIYDNEKQKECSYGQSGEICMQCISAMISYKDNETETSNLVRQHPDGSKWIHTGDIGYMDEDGFLFLEGRMKRLIMIVKDNLAYKILPSQTEDVINHCVNVKESCVVGCQMGKDIVIKAYIIKAVDIDNESLLSELRKSCEQSLSENQRPEIYEVIQEFPRTAAGKVDYRKLEEMV